MHYLIHIGYPKAASTWLQKNVFVETDPIFCPLKSATQDGDNNYKKSGAELFFDNNTAFNINAYSQVNEFDFDKDSALLKLVMMNKTPNNKITCLSNEAWVGEPTFGGYMAKCIADRISSIIKNAKILIIIRNQPDMILSMYFHALTKYYSTVNFSKMLYGNPYEAISRMPYAFKYDSLIQYYDYLYGRENVIVIPFEILHDSPLEFVRPLYEAYNCKPPNNLILKPAENTRNLSEAMVLNNHTWLNLLTEKRIHRVIRALLINTFGIGYNAEYLSYSKRILTCEINDQIAQYYKNGNSWVCNRIDINLGKLGYPI